MSVGAPNPGDTPGMELSEVSGRLIASLLIVVVAILTRFAAVRVIRRVNWGSEETSRRWVVMARNTIVAVAVFALIFVWAEELRVIGLSLVAVAVAVAISAQEVIRSAIASIVGVTSKIYSVGDRVIVGNLRGYVVDQGLVLTKLFEIGSGNVRTGRVISIPNSRLLTEPVVNETAGHKFILHSFVVPVQRREWRRARDVLLEGARKAAEPHMDGARAQMEELSRLHALPQPVIEPFVLAKPTAPDVVELTVRVPAEAQYVWKVENEIQEMWLSRGDQVAGREQV